MDEKDKNKTLLQLVLERLEKIEETRLKKTEEKAREVGGLQLELPLG